MPKILRSQSRNSSRTRVLQVVAVPFTLRFLRGQASFMRGNRVDYVAVSSPGKELDQFSEEEGIPSHNVPISRQISPLKDLISIGRLIRVIWKESPDIVHTHTPKGGLLGQISAWTLRVPVRIHTIHGLVYMTSTGKRRTLLMASERLSCRLATSVLCVSHSIREVAIADGIVSFGKVSVPGNGSANGIDLDGEFNPDNYDRSLFRQELGISEDEMVILFVGRLAKDKGIDDLAAAWELTKAHLPSSLLLLAGGIDDRDPVSSTTIEALRNDSRVRLLGHTESVASLLAAADVFVLPTYREGFPTVLLEASAMKLPIVATDIPGCSDAVEDAVTGVLVPARRADKLAAAIMSITTSQPFACSLGTAGRQRAMKYYSSETVWEAILERYKM